MSWAESTPIRAGSDPADPGSPCRAAAPRVPERAVPCAKGPRRDRTSMSGGRHPCKDTATESDDPRPRAARSSSSTVLQHITHGVPGMGSPRGAPPRRNVRRKKPRGGDLTPRWLDVVRLVPAFCYASASRPVRVRTSSRHDTPRPAPAPLPRSRARGGVDAGAARAAATGAPRWPGRIEPGVTLLPNGWTIAPAGRHVSIGDLPLAQVQSADGRYLIVSNNGWSKPMLTVYDLEKGYVSSRLPMDHAWLGLAWHPDGARLYSSAAAHNSVTTALVGRRRAQARRRGRDLGALEAGNAGRARGARLRRRRRRQP